MRREIGGVLTLMEQRTRVSASRVRVAMSACCARTLQRSRCLPPPSVADPQSTGSRRLYDYESNGILKLNADCLAIPYTESYVELASLFAGLDQRTAAGGNYIGIPGMASCCMPWSSSMPAAHILAGSFSNGYTCTIQPKT
jgi:hypothetical protein